MSENYALIVKARAIYGDSISENDYQELLKQNSVSAVVGTLKNTKRYSSFLSSVSETMIHRSAVEQILEKSIYENISHLLCFQESSEGSFYDFYLKETELNIIISVLRLINLKKTDKIISSLPLYIAPYLKIDLMQMGKITEDNAIMQLENAVSGTLCSQYLKEFRSSFALDFDKAITDIRAQYYRHFLKGNGISVKLRQIIKTEIELENLTTAYRLKNFFSAPPEEIKKRMLPFYGKISKEHFEEIIYRKSDSTEDQQKELLLLLENLYFQNVPLVTGNLEVSVRKVLLNKYRKTLLFSENPVSVLYVLSKLLKIEVMNVTAIIEGVRYSLPALEIKTLIAK